MHGTSVGRTEWIQVPWSIVSVAPKTKSPDVGTHSKVNQSINQLPHENNNIDSF
jgi:hypothetical protein